MEANNNRNKREASIKEGMNEKQISENLGNKDKDIETKGEKIRKENLDQEKQEKEGVNGEKGEKRDSKTKQSENEKDLWDGMNQMR